jgi:tRNA threonylcarbamoyladenosine biosynthesis protein TsaE
MDPVTIELADEAATAALGAGLAPLLRRGDVVALIGPLGAGKTTLARSVIRALTGEAEAPSPTFGLAALYQTPDFPLAHFDLYRLGKPEDVRELGLEEALDEGVSLIEWPERIAAFLPEDTLAIRMELNAGGRRARLLGGGDWGNRLTSAGLARAAESRKTTHG